MTMMASSPPPMVQLIHSPQSGNTAAAAAPRTSSLTAHLQSSSSNPNPPFNVTTLAASPLNASSSAAAATTHLASAAEPEPEPKPKLATHTPTPPHLQGVSHWTRQRSQWLAKRPAHPVPQAAPTDLKPELYPVVYHKMVRESRMLAPGKRLRLKDAFSLIVQGWKEDGLLPRNFVSAPASPPLRGQNRSQPVTPMSLGGGGAADPSMSRSSSTTPPAVSNGPGAGFMGLSALWKGITSSLPG